MQLNIGKLTGTTPGGSKIFQKVKNGIREITSIKDGDIVQKIRIKQHTGSLKGYSVEVEDVKKGVSNIFSDITDYGFEENYRTVSKSERDKTGATKRIAITRSKDGDSVEITKSQTRPNGEEFYLTRNIQNDADGIQTIENEFETSSFGWTKPDGSNINGFHQSFEINKDGKTINIQRFGDIDTLPKLNELA